MWLIHELHDGFLPYSLLQALLALPAGTITAEKAAERLKQGGGSEFYKLQNYLNDHYKRLKLSSISVMQIDQPAKIKWPETPEAGLFFLNSGTGRVTFPSYVTLGAVKGRFAALNTQGFEPVNEKVMAYPDAFAKSPMILIMAGLDVKRPQEVRPGPTDGVKPAESFSTVGTI